MLEEGEQKQYCEGVVEEAQVVTEEKVCECEGVRVRVSGSTVRGSGGRGPGGELGEGVYWSTKSMNGGSKVCVCVSYAMHN